MEAKTARMARAYVSNVFTVRFKQVDGRKLDEVEVIFCSVSLRANNDEQMAIHNSENGMLA